MGNIASVFGMVLSLFGMGQSGVSQYQSYRMQQQALRPQQAQVQSYHCPPGTGQPQIEQMSDGGYRIVCVPMATE